MGCTTSAPEKPMTVPKTSLSERFGVAGDILADALHGFSFDIVGVVCDYHICRKPTPGAKPRVLFAIDSAGPGPVSDTGDIQRIKFEHACFGVARSPKDELWITDERHVNIFGMDGKWLREAAPGRFDEPIHIAFDTTDEVFITDYRASTVVVCDLDGKWVRTFGSEGRDPGQFQRPWGIVVDQAGLVLVGDRDNNRVQLFSREGKLERSFGSYGSGPGQFERPRALALSPNGEIVVADEQNNRVQFFDFSGKFLRMIGSSGDAPGQFHWASAIAFDRFGYLYVGEQLNRRIQVFAPPDYTLVTSFGQHPPGSPRYSRDPPTPETVGDVRCVYIDPSDGVIYVGDEYRRVTAFAF